MDTPTVCQECLDVVGFDDMVDIAKAGASMFVCANCAEDYEENCEDIHEDAESQENLNR